MQESTQIKNCVEYINEKEEYQVTTINEKEELSSREATDPVIK